MRLFLDTNIVLDLLLDRQPFSESAADLFGCIVAGQCSGEVAGFTFATLYYILNDLNKKDDAKQTLRELKSILKVIPTDSATIDRALASSQKDYEDALQQASAEIAEVDLIVTRNAKDFVRRGIPIVESEEAVELVRASR